jgi:hypothetical protein
MVKPAKAPPSRTRAMAVLRYTHKDASLGLLGRSSSTKMDTVRWTRGKALTKGANVLTRRSTSVLTRRWRIDTKPLAGEAAEPAAIAEREPRDGGTTASAGPKMDLERGAAMMQRNLEMGDAAKRVEAQIQERADPCAVPWGQA